jgi:hypothetical protein
VKIRTRRLLLCGLLFISATFIPQSTICDSDPPTPSDFERNYALQGAAHLSVSNTVGDIRCVAWNKPSINVRATTRHPSLIADQVFGDEIVITVRRQIKPIRVDFEISAPPDTSVVLKTFFGTVELRAVKGHVSASTIDGDVRLANVSSSSLDVKVTSGDIYFDGTLSDGGSYSLQTMKGDVDVTLPKGTPFNLSARALSENINLGDFGFALTGGNRSSKGVSGTHLRGGPRLTLITYAGRIIMHNK